MKAKASGVIERTRIRSSVAYLPVKRGKRQPWLKPSALQHDSAQKKKQKSLRRLKNSPRNHSSLHCN
jgi:hypothetical protein